MKTVKKGLALLLALMMVLRLKKKNTAIPSESPCFMVREMRLELTRRLTHAPQTCLSTYSSTLASALKAKAIIHMRGALVKKEFSSFSLAVFRLAFAQCAEKTDQREVYNS